MIEIRNVTKQFPLPEGKGSQGGGTFTALKDINLKIYEKEFVSFLGASGCGKTTLLKMIQGLIAPTSGTISIAGERIEGVARNLGFVFQEVGLLPWRNVVDNVALGLQARGMDREERRERAMEYVRVVGLERFASYYPHQLSGGMQQRVGLARALAIEPRVLLMDEPFGALDAMTREDLQDELLHLWERFKVTIVFVTHDVEEATYLSDRIVMFQPSPGRICEVVEMDLPRPRQRSETATRPAAMELRQRLVHLLREKVVS